ncbi:unnamed protein product [Amoebophrya sp. A25]|nr:unnamed protein product [Amoebophrya sp. A25]|eukprot:GSA25T00014351001.1
MVIPMPSVAVAAYPSDKAMRYRNIFFALSILISAAAAVQMFVMKEIMNGFMMGLIGVCGFYCLRDQSVDMQCLMSWGIICFINGILEVVKFIDRVVHLPPGVEVFSTDNGFESNFIMVILILGMISMLVVSILAYNVYSDQDLFGSGGDDSSRWGGPRQSPRNSSYGAVQNFGGGTLGSSPAAPAQSQNFQPFQGKGNVLGA